MQAHDLEKTHTIHFDPDPPDQAAKAFQLLNGLDKLKVTLDEDSNAIRVSYSLLDYTLQGLEKALVSQGFRLDQGLLEKARRAIVHYEEEVQLDNLRTPDRLEKTKEIFVHAYEHHPHGDKDDTPEEWREYK